MQVYFDSQKYQAQVVEVRDRSRFELEDAPAKLRSAVESGGSSVAAVRLSDVQLSAVADPDRA